MNRGGLGILLVLLGSSSLLYAATPRQKEISTISADTITTNTGTKTISASGDVKVTRGTRTLQADRATYDQLDKTVEASGEIMLRDNERESLFFAEEAKVKDDLSYGTFKNGGILFSNGSSISSPLITRESEDIFRMSSSLYSVCPTDVDYTMSYEDVMGAKNQKWKLFSVSSSDLITDSSEKIVKFKHAIFRVYNVPVFYFPYFKTSQPFGEESTGLSTPVFERSGYYGYGVFLPYVLEFKNKQRLKVSPGIYENGNMLLNATFTDSASPNRDIRADATAAYDNNKSRNILNANGISERDEGVHQNARGFIRLLGNQKIYNDWNVQFNGTLVSDQYFLRDYRNDYRDFITSNIAFTNISDSSHDYFQFNNIFYQEVLEKQTPAENQTPKYIPTIDYHSEANIPLGSASLNFGLDANYTSIIRTTGQEYNRVSLLPYVQNRLETKIGDIDGKLTIRGDMYALNDNISLENRNPNTAYYDGFEGALRPELELSWKYQMLERNSGILIEPMIKYIVSPYGDSIEKRTPNEDSQAAEITYVNIFSNNRHNGYDRSEHGSRLTYGVNFDLYSPRLGIFQFGIAQGYRDSNVRREDLIRGFESDFSDIVGMLSYTSNKVFDVYYRFRLDKANFSSNSNELSITMDFNWVRFFATYTLSAADHNFMEPRQEQIQYGASFFFLDHWKLYGSATTDLANQDRTIETRMGLGYDGGCTYWDFSVNIYNYIGYERNTNLHFSFGIKANLL